MHTLFDPKDRQQILDRLALLEPDGAPRWGKMRPAQAVCHCARVLECATGDRPMKQLLIGRLLAPLVRKSALGEKPFPTGNPTGKAFMMGDERNLGEEREKLASLVRRFADAGTASASRFAHPFFGRLTGEQWGVLMYKHLDHHLRQFGA